MRVMITDLSGQEWWSLCQGMFGHQLQAVEDYTMATAPAEYGRLCIFEVDDQGPLATWITLKHPEWIEPKWLKQNSNKLIIDSAAQTYTKETNA